MGLSGFDSPVWGSLFFPAGECFSSIGGFCFFPRRGRLVLALTGGEMPARMLAGSLQHRRGGTIPGPCRGRQSCRILESGLLHPPQAALFPPCSLFGCAKKQPGPPQNPQILWGEEGQRNGAESSPEAGTEWSGFRPDDGPCTVQKRKTAEAEHTGNSNTGARRESPSGPAYISARDGGFVLLCGGG